jgi:hypothetical protein
MIAANKKPGKLSVAVSRSRKRVSYNSRLAKTAVDRLFGLSLSVDKHDFMGQTAGDDSLCRPMTDTSA